MVIHGIGVDIVDIIKIKKIITHSGDKLAKRILSKSEWKIYQNKKHPVRFLAKRFAAKEAVAKAFGTGINQGVTFSQIEIFNDKLGKPMLHLFSYTALLANKLSLKKMHITLSDTNLYACALVVFER
ncbi:holo-ACP synthase [Candidatus Blochmannia vicinus]|uniref:Holo-[acyl-carrier-protein] synthase n=1 Tax=Candidatus Blochmannia vicinus (nom. nud.) TaxID=251540 RepID=A0A9Q8X0F3_9ENTR|nr:holo-ACP synthase [Candidatus Blochmannia vicinus]URJ28432.1 holo-ACP synthase [Candidatus Blochmannia vicinus]URJ30891.1 holo-ACP synthase [Candidatus Blochmannia vicinus]URJ33331.1 holo-ACP synthase [Candidatus Blochmannia vicinus]